MLKSLFRVLNPLVKLLYADFHFHYTEFKRLWTETSILNAIIYDSSSSSSFLCHISYHCEHVTSVQQYVLDFMLLLWYKVENQQLPYHCPCIPRINSSQVKKLIKNDIVNICSLGNNQNSTSSLVTSVHDHLLFTCWADLTVVSLRHSPNLLPSPISIFKNLFSLYKSSV